MGRHGKDEPVDDGRHFGDMSPQQKADAFDASAADPHGYAHRHFQPGASSGEKYEAARSEQRDQQNKNRS